MYRRKTLEMGVLKASRPADVSNHAYPSDAADAREVGMRSDFSISLRKSAVEDWVGTVSSLGGFCAQIFQ